MSTDNVTLREVVDQDLPLFFDHQLDPEANRMAAFTAENPADIDAFEAHWDRIRSDDSIINKTIMYGDEVAGHIASFERFGVTEVTYWLGREFWGKGIATNALLLFLDEVTIRPIYARAAKDNKASLRVLEKCGFEIVGEDKAYAHARSADTEEFILELRD
ncbi:MAG: GNAT family N-acetyltransferase [Chloroflexi bacterium]|nr:GNAT family N-acetyltransferase [Chloroflexota bacterium]